MQKDIDPTCNPAFELLQSMVFGLRTVYLIWVVPAKLFLNLLDVQIIWYPAVLLHDSWLWVPCFKHLAAVSSLWLPCDSIALVWYATPPIHLESASPNFCHRTNESVSNGVGF